MDTSVVSGLVSWMSAFGHAVSGPEGRSNRSGPAGVGAWSGVELGFGASCWPERAGCLFKQPGSDQPRGGGVLLWARKGVVGAPIPRWRRRPWSASAPSRST